MSEEAKRREANRATLERALAAISAKDVDGVLACLHPSAAVSLPYQAELPDMDRSGFGELLASAFREHERFRVTLTRVIEALDPDVLVATYDGDCEFRGDGVTYGNNYVGIFEFREGTISGWREFDNPLVSIAAFQAHHAASEQGPPPHGAQ